MSRHMSALFLAAAAGLVGCDSGSDEASTAAATPGIEISAEEQSSPGSLEQRIKALDTTLADGTYGLIDEVLVQHRGETVMHLRYDQGYEEMVAGRELRDHPFEYANPKWHPYYRDTDLHTLQSVTKSVTSVLMGILEYQGAIPNVANAKVLDFLNGRYDIPLRDANWEALTVEHLLNMRTNLEWFEGGGYALGIDNDAVILENETDDWVQYVLNKPLEGPPGEEAPYEYNSGASQLLSAIIHVVTGKKAADFAEDELFGPLNINEYFWKQSPAGESDTLGGLYLKSSDLIKFCELLGQGGVWEGQRLLSQDYVDRSLRYATTFEDPDGWARGYGYKWWLGDNPTGSSSAFSGAGYGGQYPTCFTDEDLAIVIYSWNLPDVLGIDLDVKSSVAAGAIRKRIYEEILPLL